MTASPENVLARLRIALGMVTPEGTAPREVLDGLWMACLHGTDPTAPIAALRDWLQPVWADRATLLHPTPLPPADGSAGPTDLAGALHRYYRVADRSSAAARLPSVPHTLDSPPE
jgi:hypothetical protein